MLSANTFKQLENYLCINFTKNKHIYNSAIINFHNVKPLSNRLDITQKFINFYIQQNLQKYKTLHFVTSQPKQHITTIKNNDLEQFIEVLLNIRFCENKNCVLTNEIRIEDLNKFDVLDVYLVSECDYSFLYNIKTFLGKELVEFQHIIKLDNYNCYVCAELVTYAEILTLNNVEQKIKFKHNEIKFVNNKNEINFSPYEYDIFVGTANKNFKNLHEELELDLSKLENQKKLLLYLVVACEKYKNIPEFILNFVKNGLKYLELLNPKYNLLKNSLIFFVNKFDVIKNLKNIKITDENFGIKLIKDLNMTNCTMSKFEPVSEIVSLDECLNNLLECNDDFQMVSQLCLPLYINKNHWKMCENYNDTILPIFFSTGLYEKSPKVLNIYYSVLTFYSQNMFFTNDILNWDKKWIKIWIMLFYTCYHISFENKYYKGFEKYLESILIKKQFRNNSMMFGQAISVNYKNYNMLYNVFECEVLTTMISYIKNKAIEIKELIMENDPNISQELNTIFKTNIRIENCVNNFITASFISSMLKDVTGGIEILIKDIERKSLIDEENEIVLNFYDYCETFRGLEIENKIQILVNKSKIPVNNIFQQKYLTNKIVSHFQNI